MQINSREELQQWINSLPEDKHNALTNTRYFGSSNVMLIDESNNILLGKGDLSTAGARAKFLDKYADNSVKGAYCTTLILLSRQYYNNDPEFDLTLLNTVCKKLSCYRDYPLILSECFKFPEWKMLMHKVDLDDAGYDYFTSFQLSLILAEDMEHPNISKRVIKDGRINYNVFLTEDDYLNLLKNNKDALIDKLRRAVMHYDDFYQAVQSDQVAFKALFDLDMTARLQVLNEVYEYRYYEFCHQWLSIDLRYIKLLYRMLLKQYSDAKRLSTALNGLLSCVKDDNHTVCGDGTSTNTDNFRFSKSIRELLLTMRVCINRDIPKSCQSKLGKALFFIKLHDFDFMKVFDSMYGNKKSIF